MKNNPKQALLNPNAGAPLIHGSSSADSTFKAHASLKILRRAGDFFLLSKPLLVLLLLFATYAGMVVAGRSLPGLALTAWTMLGGALAAGGASAINQYIDRDVDGAMKRTRSRPLPAGRLSPTEGLAFGVAACLAGLFILATQVNLLTVLLALAGMLYYTLVYSVWLKRLTTQNIVIGAGAGAIPPLVGWAAATGRLEWNALFLFAVIFLWSPPHFWSLALVRNEEYIAAGIPMLPAVRGEQVAARQIFIYTVLLVAATLAIPFAHLGNTLFAAAAALLGAVMVFLSARLLRAPNKQNARLLFRYSTVYLALLFMALILMVKLIR
jgi:heme o synthase